MHFTSSWDDGYASDLRIADMLSRRGLSGTFYVCPQEQHGKQMLRKVDIQRLAQEHTVGAHTMTHPWLTKIPLEDAQREIVESKAWLEDITGAPCTMFCYPYGDHNADVRSLVREAGFKGARTTQTLRFGHTDPFMQPISFQVMTFPFRKRFKPAWKILDPLGPLRANFKRIREIGISLRACTSWLTFTKTLFDYALETDQPYFHLFGHSAELERFGLLEELEKFLEYAGGKL